jgi:hypothetical protein
MRIESDSTVAFNLAVIALNARHHHRQGPSPCRQDFPTTTTMRLELYPTLLFVSRPFWFRHCVNRHIGNSRLPQWSVCSALSVMVIP